MSEPQVMVVTGSASVGRRLTAVLAAAGHRLVATDVDLGPLEEHARREGWPASQVLPRKLDVRDREAWEGVLDVAMATWGRLDVLLNIAGVLRCSYAHSAPAEDVDLHLDVNAKGVIHGTRAAARRMIAQGHGHIVNMASMAAHCPLPGMSLYVASKFAVRGFSLSAAHELRPHGVRVTVVCPDAVRTPLIDRQVDRPEAALAFSGPLLAVEDVVDVIVKRVLTRQPLEVILPRGRGLLARAAGVWPGLGLRIAPLFWKRGEERRQALRGRGVLEEKP